MHFYPTAQFTIPRQSNRLIDHSVLKEFWNNADQESGDDVSQAIGCYIFSVKAGGGNKPWYVGKAERQSFRKECFAHHKLTHYNNLIADRVGTPTLTLVAKYTPGSKLVTPTGGAHRDISALETMLIATALSRNSELLNLKDTKLLREMSVPGLINSSAGKPSTSVAEFKKLLGL